MNLIERRKRKLIIFTVLCILVFTLFIWVLVRNGKVAAATCPECTSHPTLSAATCEKPATCPQCGYQTGSALGHKFVRFNVGSGDGCVVQMGCQRCGCINQVNFGNHTWAYGSYFNNGTKCMVKMRCQRCGIIRTLSREHTYVTKYDETNHWEACSRCGVIKTDSKEEHMYDENGKCKCGVTKQAEETCEHEYATKYDATNHWEECSKCGFIKANSIAEHAYDENGKCKCGATKQTEEICEHEYVTKYDATNHWEECSKCGFIKTDSIAEHAYDENGKCKCGAIKQAEETCEHTYATQKDETYHWEECSKCKEIKTNSKEKHSYTNGKCKCGATKQEEETCEHTYVTKKDTTYHWEECSKCKEIKTNSKEEHKGIKWTDEGNGTHSGTCSVCNFKLKEEHSYTNGKCTECGVEESSKNETCEHKYAEKHDETYHWEECSKCNDLKKGTLQTHKYKEYTDNKNGTHTTTCTICGYKLTEEHLTECEKCNKQVNTGNKENDNTDNNDNNKENNNIDKNGSKDEENTNNDKKDNTAIDKNLPYTGTSKIITLVIIILSALITLTVFKLKKYKGIK